MLQPSKPAKKEKQQVEEKMEEIKPELKKEQKIEPILKVKELEVIKIIKERKAKALSSKTIEFVNTIKDHLIRKDIELLQEIASKPKEFHAKISIDTPLGKQEFFMTAKEKKKVTEDDLAAAIHRAQSEKMPALVLAKGDLDKDARAYLDSWKSMLKFEK